jgi:hypothetical protein
MLDFFYVMLLWGYSVMPAVRCCALILILILLSAHPNAARSQQFCQDTPKGHVCGVQLDRYVAAGNEVPDQTQKRLGLVSISTGCSGTLLNRYWVLTARHCVTMNGRVDGRKRVLPEISVTAKWASGVGRAVRIRDFKINIGRARPIYDIVLIYLGAADLGEVNTQNIYTTGFSMRGVLRRTDTVTQYGQGYYTFARGTYPNAIQASGLGKYRSGQFRPSGINEVGYTLAMNTRNQVGHGGDSGGPTVVTVNNNGVDWGFGIAGIQSTCTARDYVRNLPRNRRNWAWATGISACQYVSTNRFINEIAGAIGEAP